jgi:hypothetical protein
MRFDFAALLQNEVLQTSASDIEGRIDGGIEVLMRVFRDDLASGHGDVDASTVLIAMLRMSVRFLNRHAAAHGVTREGIKLGRPRADILVDRLRLLDVTKCDLDGALHGTKQSKTHA